MVILRRCSGVLFVIACVLALISGSFAQGVPQSLSAPSPLPRAGGLDLAPSSAVAMPASAYGGPQGSDAIPLSSGMFGSYLPRIPNLELGFLYSFGNNVRTGRFTADYVLPFRLSGDSVLFGEAHAEGWDFWKRPTVSVASPPGFTVTSSATGNRVDLSFGGGYRTMFGANTFLGVNGFYDTSRLFNQWYSSGGVGLEMAANVAGDDAIDLNFNWYGNLFNRDVLVNAFRNRGNSFDVEAGYSHALFNQALDLRLKLVGYQFDMGTAVHGWRGGADLTTRDGVFTLRYEHGSDRLNGDYNTVGGFVNVGFQLENLLRGESPFTLPEPVFKSPRDLRRLLGLKVKRNWHQPEAVVLSRSSEAGGGTGCDRLLAPFPLTNLNPTWTNLQTFAAFPFASLDPARLIRVTITFANPAPSGLFVSVAVIGANNATTNQGFAFAAGGETSLTIPLTIFGPQNAFILASTNPDKIVVTVVQSGFGTNGISSVCIRFNQ